jgi:glutamine cyclotransferase
VRTYPHDTKALTQGPAYKEGFLYETRGTSSLRKVELATGKVVQRFDIDPMQQAEGLAEYKGRWYQMTPLNGYGRIFDQTFKEVGRFDYGFGMAEFGGSPNAAWAIGLLG